MSSFVITVKSARSDLSDRLVKDTSNPRQAVVELAQYFKRMASGNEAASLDVQTDSTDAVAASGTVILVSVSADETLVIGGTTLTAKASPANENQFSQAGTDAQDAASLVSKINAHSTLSKVVTASAVNNVVTITCRVKGVVGNFITLVETGNGMTVSGATLSGGTGGATSTAVNYSLGL